MKGKVMEELKKAFRPEFLNRIDEIIVFHSLERKHLKRNCFAYVRAINETFKRARYCA